MCFYRKLRVVTTCAIFNTIQQKMYSVHYFEKLCNTLLPWKMMRKMRTFFVLTHIMGRLHKGGGWCHFRAHWVWHGGSLLTTQYTLSSKSDKYKTPWMIMIMVMGTMMMTKRRITIAAKKFFNLIWNWPQVLKVFTTTKNLLKCNPCCYFLRLPHRICNAMHVVVTHCQLT